MPKITSSAELRNNYNEISSFCHEYDEPVFITKNGKGDLAVMSIEAYEQLTARFELYGALKQGLDDIEAGRVVSAEDEKRCSERNILGQIYDDVQDNLYAKSIGGFRCCR